MTISQDFINYCEKRFAPMGPEDLRRQASFPPFPLSADCYARFSGRSLWKFFPYDDYFFVHDFTGRDTESRHVVEELHESARGYVNSLYHLPRLLRYRVPNINTVSVSARGFGFECQRYAHSIRPSIIGGERNSVFMVDLVNHRLISTGIEVTEADMVAIAFKKVNPHNRALGVMTELCAEFYRRGAAG